MMTFVANQCFTPVSSVSSTNIVGVIKFYHSWSSNFDSWP